MCLLFRTCGPNKVMVISGVGYSKPGVVKGGRVFQVPCFHTVSKIKLNVMTTNITSRNVNCANGVQITIQGVAQCKINAETSEALDLAIQHFIGMKEANINQILTETLEGHQRSIISTMTIEEIFRDREQFGINVRKVATPDLMGMGISLISYTISSCQTENGYLAALAKPNIALVQRDARIGQAKATRDADIATAEAVQARDEKVFQTKVAIEQYTIDRDTVVQANKKLINTAQAIAYNAERLKKAELDQTLVNEKLQIKLIERKGQAKVMDEEMKLQEKRLEATTLLDAECKKYTTEIDATADRTVQILEAEANATQIQCLGDAEAEATTLKSNAEAKTTALKAIAYEQFGKAALVGEVIKTLPKIASEIAAPTRDMKKVTIVSSGQGEVGFNRITNEIMRIMNEVPDGVNEITGIDLKGEIRKAIA